MTVSDSLDRLPGVAQLAVNVVGQSLQIDIEVKEGSPAHSIFKECGLPERAGSSTSTAHGWDRRTWFRIYAQPVPKDGAPQETNGSPHR